MKKTKILHERRKIALSQESPCSVIRAFLEKHSADEKEWNSIDAIESCGFGNTIGTDLCLPNAFRTEANLWKTKYFEMVEEVRKANKGIMRLKKLYAAQLERYMNLRLKLDIIKQDNITLSDEIDGLEIELFENKIHNSY